MDAFIAVSIAVNGVVFCAIARLDEKTFSCCGGFGQQNASVFSAQFGLNRCALKTVIRLI
ncbi:MAG TPA: hypothetical protein PKD17_01370 [Cellvibrionaceae bacterium]|nr:hypothetical protein [Cellvibrionaceae bacterium]HMW70435.1 hypothetical protein [Cellvibrionaceae bacterium]HMY38218.1 hypothetical protein [Marinagarivorans sp.]HNG58525.1 hypothetical protein [Cellvibrionaceae bacterium]